MNLNTVILDIDGSLMPIGGGIHVKESVKNALIEVEKKGYTFIINSARESQGVLPLAHQLEMEKYGGYVISFSGALGTDMKTGEQFLQYPIPDQKAERLWQIALSYDFVPCIGTEEFMIVRDWTEGYGIDFGNGGTDFVVTPRYQKFMTDTVWKGCVSGEPEALTKAFPNLKKDLAALGLDAIQSIPSTVDVFQHGVSKMRALDELFEKIGIGWQSCTAIGDTDGDAECIRKAAYGVTPANGSAFCKEAADFVVPSVDEDGCLVWLNQLIEGKID
ncbi:HAD hydrolase family protein [Catenisphaera adipataccumulans]|uniref:HAD family phosphatase n=1 Tax=Catenisphaera adipataccumulans TaxID=700500 RepID=A0A7W8CZ52_9FIRM|nr:HAD family hydrolase [Catenisphaera adipataccumulans]MBB5183078.1 hypothetical protein [Catenisphaera adipataccumulans]